MKHAKKKMSRFWKIYAAATVILLVIVAAGLGVFYDFIRAYELSQPENTADTFVQSFDSALLESWITEAAETLEYYYETRETVVLELLKTVNSLDADYSWQREYGIAAETPVFRLYRGSTWIGRFRLTDTKEGKFGFSSWTVDHGEAVLSALEAGNIAHSILAPKDAKLYVNGVEARPQDCVSGNAAYPYLDPLDKKDALTACLYSIEGLFAEPNITCVLNGETCVGETEQGITRFRVPTAQIPSYTFRIPHSAELIVNGNTVSEDYRSGEQLAYSYSKLEEGTAGLPTEDVYVIAGLLVKPEVSVRWDNLELEVSEKENVFRAAYPEARKYSSTLLVPQGSEITVRGNSCRPYFTGETVTAYPELYTESTSSPLYDVYRIDSLYLPLEDVSVSYEGKTLPYTERKDNCVQNIEAQYPDYENEEVRSRALTFVKDYVHYVAYGYSNTSENLADALRHVKQGSDLYTRIQRSKIGIAFVTPVTSQKYNLLEIKEMRKISEDSVYCSISFDIDQYIYSVHRSYTGTMELNCRFTGSRWVIDEMLISTDN